MNPGAIARFRAAQSRLLDETYDRAWRHGVHSYEPDEDPQNPRPPDDTHPDVVAAVGVGAAAALLAKRLRRYHPPTEPDADMRARALAPAAAGLARMAGELQQLAPTVEHFQAAEDAVRAGSIPAEDMRAYSDALATQEWLDSEQWRLTAGESAAWAGEQVGYAQAADADGQLLEWLPESDGRQCEDCEALGDLPPMQLADWPTTPGAGNTICSVGCRCVMQVSDEQLQPGDALPALSEDEEALVGRIAEAREPRVLPTLA